MRLLKKGLTESIYNSILNEGSFGDEVGFGDFSSIDEMEEEFTNKLYSFLNFIEEQAGLMIILGC